MVQIMESISVSTTLVVNSCDNISYLIQASTHPEVVTSQWKQAHLISSLSETYHSIESVMYMSHVYGHRNSGRLVLTLTPLASLNVQLDALAEHIMA